MSGGEDEEKAGVIAEIEAIYRDYGYRNSGPPLEFYATFVLKKHLQRLRDGEYTYLKRGQA